MLRSVLRTNLAKKLAMSNCGVFILISFYLLIGSTCVFTQKMTAIRAKIYDHSVVEEFNFTLVPFQGHYAVNSRVVFKIDMKNLLTLLTLDLAREGQPPYRMLSMKKDACKFLEGSYKHMAIANLVLKSLSKIKNFPRSCPLKAYRPIMLDSFKISWQQLPIYMPNMDFNVTAVFFKNGKKISELIVKGTTTDN